MVSKTSSSKVPHTLLLPLSLAPLLLLFVPLPAHNLPTEYPTDIISLTRTLVSIPSPTGHEQLVFSYVKSWLKHHDWTIHTHSLPPLTPGLPKRENVLALLPNANLKNIKLVLSTHLDTVPGTSRDDIPGYVGGRGSVDAKGQAAALLLSAMQTSNAQVAVLLVAGEEFGHAGMLNAHHFGLPPNIILLNAEPTEGKLVTRQKGALKIHVNATGRSCHSGYPHLGESAVNKLLDVLQMLRGLEADEEGLAMNIGRISGGVAPNVLAPHARAEVFFRIPQSALSVLEKVRKLVADIPGVTIDAAMHNDAIEYHVPRKMGEKVGTTQVAYNTDVPYYKGGYKYAVLIGGGSITVAHTDEERISEKELRDMVGLFGNVTMELLE